MFARYFLPLCLLALFAIAVHANEDVQLQNLNEDVAERANPAAKVVAKIIGKIFAGAAASCLWEAAENCKSHWKNPGKALSCGKTFLKNNKGRCAVGK